MKMIFRPLHPWTDPVTRDDARRSRYTFKANWRNTLKLLAYELDWLGTDEYILEADFRPQDLRIDGTPRANAQQPPFPGVRVFFDSIHGPLVYATDSCEFWQHNVRSIALGLESLRAVDRYGVTRRGEQYRGWTAIGATPMPGKMSIADATDIISDYAGLTFRLNRLDPDALRFAYNKAARATHPDNGGTRAAFQRLQAAKAVLDEAVSK